VCPNIRYFGVEFLKGNGHICGDLSGKFDVGVRVEEERDHQVLDMGQVDEVLLVVEVDCPQFGVGLGLSIATPTFCKLLWVWLRALISSAVVCANFSFYFWGTLWEMRTPSLSDSMMPRTQLNSSITRFRN
jgi:hypothetical protein